MTTSALPAPAAAPKNLQARGTVGILNTVRWITVAFFGLVALLGVVFMLANVAQGETSAALVGLLISGASLIYGALAYAFIGWYVDTLNLLTQIARNTSA